MAGNKHGSEAFEQSSAINATTPSGADAVTGTFYADPTSGAVKAYVATSAGTYRELGFEYDWAINFVIDGGGSAITTGVKGYLELPFAGTIESVRLLADQSGSIVVDIWKDTYANYPPTDADSITASAVPTISTATKSEDTGLTGWTTTFSAGDIVGFNVDSITTLTRVTLSLRGRHT